MALKGQLGQHGHDCVQEGSCIPLADQQLANRHPAQALGGFLLALLPGQPQQAILQPWQRDQGRCPEAQGLEAIASGTPLVAEGLVSLHPQPQNQGPLGRLQTGHGK